MRTPEYAHQCEINGRLGGKVMAIYLGSHDESATTFSLRGVEPNSRAENQHLAADVKRGRLLQSRISRLDSAPCKGSLEAKK